MAGLEQYAVRKRSTPTLGAGVAYTSGDVVGGIQSWVQPFNDSKAGVLKSLTIKDRDNQKPVLTILIFDQLPAGTYTDNAAFAWGTGDFAKLIGFVSVAQADYIVVASEAIAEYDVSMVVGDNSTADKAADTNLWYVLVAGGTPNFTHADALELQAGILQS